MRRFYFDYAATTPIDPEVLKEINSNLRNNFGNPGSLNFFGQAAMAMVDKSREKIANAINADFREIIFTGSATEANNLALRGILKNARLRQGFGGQVKTKSKKPRIIVSAIEHESILETARDLSARGGSAFGGEKEGVEIIYLPVDKNGVVDLKKLENALNERTILVSIMYANNETGVIQPIAEIAEIIKKFKEKKYPKPYTLNPTPYFHTDAVQAFQFLDCNIKNLGVDLMTLSAHKIYGPKGIGALYVRNSQLTTYNLQPIITGGKQEFGLRSGTENVAMIAGFAKAIELANEKREKEKKRIFLLAQYFFKEIKKIVPSAQLNAGKAKRLPNILNIAFSGYDAESLLIKFDLNGTAVSRGSACMARSSQSSYVLKEMGLSESEQRSSLRFSFGRFTTKEEMSKALKIIKKTLK
ncbi:MAG: cysteine desulfurase [Candidatus Wolfebacteria bacterium]|nr:cysteine desulfurase [Candidatus Wolfebacteria bacterium]